MQYNDFNKDVTKGTIEYSYRRPSVEFLNSIDNPITAILAALGPREIWNKQFYKEYLKFRTLIANQHPIRTAPWCLQQLSG